MIIITDAEANMIDRTDMKLKRVNVSWDVIIGVLLSDIVDITVTVVINIDKQDVTGSVVELNSFIYDKFLKVEVISCDVIDVEVISCDVTDVEVISSCDVDLIFSEESIVILCDILFSLMMMLTSLNSLLSIAVIIVPGLICLPPGSICDTSKYISLCVT